MIDSFTGKNRWLSNFWECDVTYEGRIYPSAEAAYQAAKTTDLELRKEFETLAANKAKRLGREIPIRPDWEQVKLKVMVDVVRDKFKDPELRDRLLATDDQALVEGNWWGDTYWGVCKGQGENHLGKILMQVRSEAKQDEELKAIRRMQGAPEEGCGNDDCEDCYPK